MKSNSFALPARLVSLSAFGVFAAASFAQVDNESFLNSLSTTYIASNHPAGSVLKVKLDDKLQSNKAKVGDKFTATLDTEKTNAYFGLPFGTKIEGHVSQVQARHGKTPGMIAMDFDAVKLSNGETFPIEASLIKFDKASVTREDGRYMATPAARHINANYIASGAIVGAGAALLFGGDVLTGGILGALVGYLIGENGGISAEDVTLKPGTVMGVRFDTDAKFNITDW